MSWIPQICASRNLPFSTHATLTSFHVRVLDALRAASTAPSQSPSLMRQEHRRGKLEMELYRSLAALYISLWKQRSPTSWIWPTLGLLMSSCRDARLSVIAYAYMSSVSILGCLICWRHMSRYLMSSSHRATSLALAMTSSKCSWFLALSSAWIAGLTLFCSSCASARRVNTWSSPSCSAKSYARSRSCSCSMSTATASVVWLNFLYTVNASSYKPDETQMFAMSRESYWFRR
mmetsp:Transcript_13917/g.39578  ORF Transcript_13917/g.39578 Transcript_13917/m.39578 type:complete len:233 (-) Transcript_13917:3385-4083(-)